MAKFICSILFIKFISPSFGFIKSKCIFKHAAAVTHGSKILGSGINDGSRTKWGQWIKVCMHAEMMADAEAEQENMDQMPDQEQVATQRKSEM